MSRHLAGRPTLQTRWPSAHYRTALRALLNKATDAELGFFIIQGHANDPDAASPEPPPSVGPSQVAVSDVHPAMLPTVTVPPAAALASSDGAVPLGMTAERAVVQVSMPGDAAVTVVYHDAVPPGHVAVVAGRARLLINPAGEVLTEVAPAVVGTPTVAGQAPKYSVTQPRRSR
ncbi:hypothetical protein ACQPYA_18140 [Micromonospora sp. CA-263727]|uniref:hypothetical protein n=1 Tax=Micromonospora sp. CA-263727 TaxID=3239967 RepID=UPI003D912C5B